MIDLAVEGGHVVAAKERAYIVDACIAVPSIVAFGRNAIGGIVSLDGIGI